MTRRATVIAALAVAAVFGGVVFGFQDGLQANQHPTASFDWSMPARFGMDGNSDGLIDYFPETSDRPGLSGEIDPGTFTVNLDACASSGDSDIVSYRWDIEGTPAGPSASCTLSRSLAEGTYRVTLTVEDEEGDVGTVSREVVVQDWLIVSLGDSYGSGEGAPDQPIPGPAYDNWEAAVAARDDAQADFDQALEDLGTAEANYDDTVAQLSFTAGVCGWSDTDGDDLFDTWDPFSVELGCLPALIDLALDAFFDTLDLLGEELNDLKAAARATLDLATSTFDLAKAALNDAKANLVNAEEALTPVWQDERCHRSANAGSAQAALRLEQMDPRTSVTFVHIACSGAEVANGFIGRYAGIETPDPPPDCAAAPTACLPPQAEEAAALAGDREIDALYASIGGNDAHFGPIVTTCMALQPCYEAPPTLDPLFATLIAKVCVVTVFWIDDCSDFLTGLGPTETAQELLDEGIVKLRGEGDEDGLYDQMAEKLGTEIADLSAGRVYLSEYPNPSEDDDGSYCEFDALDPLATLPGWSDDETVWVDEEMLDRSVSGRLNDTVADATAEHGWNFVTGVYDAFAGHGYCATDHWFVRLQESFVSQGNHNGTAHPATAGYRAYRDQILTEWLPDLYAGGDIDQPRRPAQPPLADANGPYDVDEGSSIQLDGSGSYSPDLDPITFSWSPTAFATGSSLTDAGTSTPTFHAADDGAHVVTLTASDDDGADADDTTVQVHNVDPTVSLGSDATAPEGALFQRTGTFADPGADSWTATVDYGDGTGTQPLTINGNGLSLSHGYADNGGYTVNVCVSDDDGGSGCDSLLVTVSNAPPTVDAGADTSAAEGATVALGPATFNDPGTLDTHTATVDWGDDTPAEPATVTEAPFGPPGSTSGADGNVAASHVYADDGVYEVTVCVMDDDGGSDCDALEVTVTNVAPTVHAGADRTLNEGETLALAPATFNDNGTLDTHTATIDWGDGSAVEPGTVTETPAGPPGSSAGADGTVAGSHLYLDDGAYTLTVCVTDDDGATSCDSLLVTVHNVPPVVAIDSVGGGAPFFLEGVPLAIDASFTDAGILDTHTAEIDWGDGSPVSSVDPATSPFSLSHTYSDAGLYDVTVTVTDDDGGSDSETASVEVLDPVEAVSRIIEQLYALSTDPGTNLAAVQALLSAIEELEGKNGGAAHNGAFSLLDTEQWGAGVEKIEAALYDLAAAQTTDPDLDLGFTQSILAWVAKAVAVDIISQAEAVASSKGELKAVDQAKALLTEGDTLLADGVYAAAVDSYQKAVGRVEKLVS